MPVFICLYNFWQQLFVLTHELWDEHNVVRTQELHLLLNLKSNSQGISSCDGDCHNAFFRMAPHHPLRWHRQCKFFKSISYILTEVFQGTHASSDQHINLWRTDRVEATMKWSQCVNLLRRRYIVQNVAGQHNKQTLSQWE